MTESLRQRIERLEREAQARIDEAKRKHPERFTSHVVYPGTKITQQDLDKSSAGRKVYGQSEKDDD